MCCGGSRLVHRDDFEVASGAAEGREVHFAAAVAAAGVLREVGDVGGGCAA